VDLKELPKAELHVHLDGSLRPSTMVELAQERGVALPASDAVTLAERMVVRRAASLEQYLAAFAVTLSLMQDHDSIERVAYELAQDHAAEGIRYVEVRFCPSLCTEGGLSSEAVLDAALAGLRRAEGNFPIRAAIIVSALRTLPASHSLEMAELAVAYRARGVCALDLAGAEAGHPVRDHMAALTAAGRAGLPVTIHAGEAYGPASIREAIELGGARRIGHGTRLFEDEELLHTVRDRGIPLEVCLTSNLQTGAVRSYAAHPVRRYFDQGVRICLCTDNRLMSGVTLTREYEHARDESGFSSQDLTEIARTGFEAAFVADDERTRLLGAFDEDVARLS
jgi:adenosine deaminase